MGIENVGREVWEKEAKERRGENRSLLAQQWRRLAARDFAVLL